VHADEFFGPHGISTAVSANGVDERLVAAATSGDGAAFSAQAEWHRRELQVHAYRMLGSLEDAQDAVQDGLLRTWRSRATYDGRATFRAWLYRITTNACLRILGRRPRRLVPYEAGPAAALGAVPNPPADLPWLQPNEAPRPRRDTSDVTLDLRKLLITIIVVWLVVSAAFIVLSFFGESEGSGTALRLL
jgi:DNA-directed RNA polymerase specialized sigma24 family protein